MRRFTSVLLSILAGGIAVGIGMGFFLHLANADRERLAVVAEQAQAQSRDAEAARDKAVNEANQKLDTANAEITKAEDAVAALTQERDLIAEAHVLVPPQPRTVRGWKEAVDLDLQASCKFPPGNAVVSNDSNGLVISQTTAIATSTDVQLLSILPYDTQRETEMQNAFTTSTPVSYVASGHLLIGAVGHMDGVSNQVYALRVQKEGVPTHLIWLKDPATDMDGSVVANILASLSFQQ